jgi:hypothetical protein
MLLILVAGLTLALVVEQQKRWVAEERARATWAAIRAQAARARAAQAVKRAQAAKKARADPGPILLDPD